MGIRGLLSHCLERRDQCTEKVDLIEIAAQQNGIELLVDFYSFQSFVANAFWKSLQSLHRNPYLRISGGEYASLDTYLTKFVTDLKSLDISLVFFIDGGKGSCPETTRQKLDTWVERHKRDLRRMTTILEVCSGMRAIADLADDCNIRPVLLEVQIISTLRRCDCEVVQCVAGEADYVLAKSLTERDRAFAVLSGDTDFCVFKGGRFICYDLWDLNGEMELGLPSAVPKKPTCLLCEVITSEKLSQQLGFHDISQLIEMSIVAGNDFTMPIMHNIHLDIQGWKCITSFAEWTKKYQTVENHPTLRMEMRRNPKFQTAVEHSRHFYLLHLNEEVGSSFKDVSTTVIEEGVKRGDYCPNFVSMNNSFYWQRMLLEDISHGCSCVEIQLCPLRSYIYKLVLPRHKHFVTEYGRTPWEEFKHATVNATDDRTVPPINYIQKQQIFRNLKFFHHIMTHMEPAWDPNKTWFDRYGRKNGFIAYILRYFLVLNWGQNLYVTEKEFFALVAMVYGRCDESLFQPIDLRPVTRCVTLGNWFQDIYRHAHQFLGKILYLTHEFPLPKEIFSGSVWTVFFVCSTDELFYMVSRHDPAGQLHAARQKMNEIIHEKRHIIKYLVDGVFPFADRW
ncbi:uncharacterized protein LOC121390373 [Gigantopelta aegis]|uniref:uncharacterized protein LOC121390373 n=1 Tax=Gigantopelta aegis TaxID=1735272 RepID=UPI001B88953D|nr:uncharacterized protein LOC121390373 [Gigantopelta aegis]